MEDLISILIYAFILYLFLSPLFRKKSKSPPAETTYEDEYDYEMLEDQLEEKPSQDILKEIEIFFGHSKKTEIEEETIEKDEEITSSFETKTYEFKIQDKFEIKPHTSENIEKDFKIEAYDYEISGNNYEIDEFDYTKIDEENIESSKESENAEKIRTFSLSLENVNDFKKAVIYKEIFEVPLAMKLLGLRWRRSIY